jgi:predicted ester cyclase
VKFNRIRSQHKEMTFMPRKTLISLLAVVALIGVYSFAAAQADTAEADLEANKELVHQYVAVLNGHDVDGLDDVLSADFQEHNPFAPEFPPGAEAFKQLAGGIITAFPDVEITVDYILAEGDMVATRHTIVATNEGEFNGIPASNLPATWTENHLFRIADGKIVEHWAELNVMTILGQIGAMPMPPAS